MNELSENEMESMIWAAELGSAPSVDLHELFIENALDELETFIHRAMMRDERVIRIIHGGGSGKLKKAIHHRLEKQDSLVLYFRESTKPGEAGNITYALLASLD